MFDVTPNDIAQLSDSDLRELVGRLCEAELAIRGLSPVAVTWGGHQTAADGGLDVRVALPPEKSVEGYIPRPSTGFQVKKSDMPRAKIIREMRPSGAIRPVIRQLADEAGAYLIVSGAASAETALARRRSALREGLEGVASADELHTDFYDRTRMATWVRCHAGLVIWVRARVGRALDGWRPYGPWSGAAEGVDAEYLVDDKLRLHLGEHLDAPALPVVDAIDELRDALTLSGASVRLVGLSGVGKTRLVQALFDARIGSRALPPSLAVYTNLADRPAPQPIGLATDLIANRMRAILIVDNCPAELHRGLTELCRGPGSTLSILTVEYDIRDDQPEGTQVVTLDTSSPELIEKLVHRRYSRLSQVDVGRITEASGGNARIAIALAETVERSESIAGLSDDELFQRLFRQRHDPDNALFRAAQACSLVYSFHGESLTGDEAEIPRLAELAGQAPKETYRHVSELLRRQLVQQRGVWRAVLPHAIANRLAARALDDTPYELLHRHFVEGGTERLARSFSRRLSYLHDHPKALEIVKTWLAPSGLLGDATAFNALGRAMFENVAPVVPEAALTVLERAGSCHAAAAPMAWRRHLSLLRSLAYDASLFERSAHLLAQAALLSEEEWEAREASDTFASLFTLHLSGTHATIEQRLKLIEQLLRSTEAKARTLGLAALDNVFEATYFSASHLFEFGARSRNYGYQPQDQADVSRWYCAAIAFVERLALSEGLIKSELGDVLARNLRGLWTPAEMYNEVERAFRGFAAKGFWRRGWVACREAMRFEKERMTPEAMSRLSTLESHLRPSSLADHVRAMVLIDGPSALFLQEVDSEDDCNAAAERMEMTARELGAAVAADDSVFAELLPDLLRGGSRVWTFGCGLASASQDRHATWRGLVEGLDRIAPARRDVQVLMGFLAELWVTERELAEHLLDSAVDQPAMADLFPLLHSAVELDERGVERLKGALRAGQAPISMYRNLALGRTTDRLSGGAIKELLLLIADQPDGFDVALELLYARLHADRRAKREHEPELLNAGRELLRRVTFHKDHQRDDYELEGVARACLAGSDAGPIAAEVATRLRRAVLTHPSHVLNNDGLLRALFELQPIPVLDAYFSANEADQRLDAHQFSLLATRRANPVDVISCETLVDWCEVDPGQRYPRAASVIAFWRQSDASAPREWSEKAKALLAKAPDPRRVLEVFVQRFRPMMWRNSWAAQLEENARLLDTVSPHVPASLLPYVIEAKAKLAQEVAGERERETERGRKRNERFE